MQSSTVPILSGIKKQWTQMTIAPAAIAGGAIVSFSGRRLYLDKSLIAQSVVISPIASCWHRPKADNRQVDSSSGAPQPPMHINPKRQRGCFSFAAGFTTNLADASG